MPNPHFQIAPEDNGLETSTLGLNFKVREKHFKASGDLKLKCTAVIAAIYWKSNEESVQGVGRPRSALASESRSSRDSGSGKEDPMRLLSAPLQKYYV